MSTTTYLITGAARGIGFRAVSVLLQRPSTVVIATVRNVNDATTESLRSLPKAESSTLHIQNLDISQPKGAINAIDTLRKQGIASLDVVIANAGMVTSFETALETKPEDMLPHFDVNCVGQLRLFQACYPLLKKGGDGGKAGVFCFISSGIGSIAAMEALKCLAYGCSKAALNFLARKIHVENTDITSFALHPGWVRTDMGNSAADAWGEEQAPMSVEESADAVLASVDKATREGTSGKFLSYDGSEIPW